MQFIEHFPFFALFAHDRGHFSRLGGGLGARFSIFRKSAKIPFLPENGLQRGKKHSSLDMSKKGKTNDLVVQLSVGLCVM